MTEEKPSTITDHQQRHYHFISTEPDNEAALKVLAKIDEMGRLPGTIERSDGKIDVYMKFTPAEELFYHYEQKQCNNCHFRDDGTFTLMCDPAGCPTKRVLNNAIWHEKMGFHNIILKRYKMLVALNS